MAKPSSRIAQFSILILTSLLFRDLIACYLYGVKLIASVVLTLGHYYGPGLTLLIAGTVLATQWGKPRWLIIWPFILAAASAIVTGFFMAPERRFAGPSLGFQIEQVLIWLVSGALASLTAAAFTKLVSERPKRTKKPLY